MIVWPDLLRKIPAAAEPVEQPPELSTAKLAPPVDAPEQGIEIDTAPSVPPPGTMAGAKRGKEALLGSALLALGASLLAHGAMVAFVLDRLKPEGVDAVQEAVSVELIFETQPEEPTAAGAGEANGMIASGKLQENNTGEQAKLESVPDALPRPVPANALPSVDDTTARAGAPAAEPAAQGPADRSDRPAIEHTPPLAPLPLEAIPTPTPRPEPPVAMLRRKTAPAGSSEQPASQQKVRPQQVRKALPPSNKAGDKERLGGASKGQINAYIRRVKNHLERHKRHPREAERQNIRGTATIAVIFDRRGRLISAKLTKGSGHAVLDQAALATARRAAPYPRPPDGIGDDTIGFSTKLDFRQ